MPPIPPLSQAADCLCRLCRLLAWTCLPALLVACGGDGSGTGTWPGTASAQATPRVRPQAISLVGADPLPLLLPFIEQNFAPYFPGPQTTRTQGDISYRTYSNGNAVGYDSTSLYAMGPVVNSPDKPVLVASLKDYCGAHLDACATTLQRTLVVGGLTREYLVYVPWTARQRAGKAPVVFVLHGSGQSGKVAMNHFGWPALADSEGMLLVFPSALTHCFNEDTNGDGRIDAADQLQVEAKWASGTLGAAGVRPLCTAEQMIALRLRDAPGAAASDHPLADDVEFFRRMATSVLDDFGADPKRLYLSGFSGGGEMTHRLVSEMSTTFASAHLAAGTNVETPLARATRPMSLLYTSGTVGQGVELPIDRDLTVPPNVVPNTADRVVALTGVIGIATTPHSFNGPLDVDNAAGTQHIALYSYTTSTLPTPPGNSFTMVLIAALGHDYPAWLAAPVWQYLKDKSLP